MNRLQRGLGGIGILVAVLGIAMIFQPRLAGVVTTRRLLVSGIGVLALVQALRVIKARRRVRVTRAEPPTPEPFARVPTPGHVFDEPLFAIDEEQGIRALGRKREFRERLTDVAVTVLAHREGGSHERARERLRAGDWTEDPHAAAFLGDGEAPEPPWYERIRLKLRREPPFRWRARRTMDAIVRAGTPDEGRTSGEGEGRVS